MEFLNLLSHLLFHAPLQSSLVEYNDFAMLFLDATSFWSLLHGNAVHCNTSFSLGCMAPTPFTWLDLRRLVFLPQNASRFEIAAAIIVLTTPSL